MRNVIKKVLSELFSLNTYRKGNGMVVMAVTAAAISSAVALGIAKTQNAQFKAMDRAKDERMASQYAQDRADVIRSTKYSSLDDARLSRQQIGTSGYYEEVTVEPSASGDEKLVRINIYKGGTSSKAISTLAVKRTNPGSIQANLVQGPGIAIDAAMSQKAATDTFVMRDNVYDKTETEFFVRQEIATALFDALKAYLPRTEAEQVYRLCSESYTKGDTDSLLTALETVLNGKTDANKGRIDALSTYFDANGYATRAIADQHGNNIAATYMRKDGSIANADYATNAASATKATNDGNGNNIASTYRKIVDSYTKSEVDAKDGTKLNTSGGTMTGDISYKGSQSTNSMIRFMNNTSDPYGNGISIGGGGEAIFGAGESASAMQGNVSAGNEDTYITADGSVHIRTNMDSGYNGNNKQFTFGSNGNLTVPGAIYEGGTALSSKYAPLSHSHNYLEKLAWWNYGDSHNVDSLNSGTTFAYTTHNAPTTGTIASFSCTSNNYPFQIQGCYYSNDFFLRNKNGDNGTWLPWISMITSANIGSQTAYKASYDSSGNHIASMFSNINSAVNAKLASSTFTSTAVTHGANVQVGSGTRPVYIASNGVATASSSTVGSSTKPIYLNNGVFTEVSTAGVSYCTTPATTTSTASSTKPCVVVQNYRNGTEWYRVWSDGWIEQGGRVPHQCQMTVYFHKPFSNTDYTVTCQSYQNWTGMIGINKLTTTYFVAHDIDEHTGCTWYACGY